MKQTFQLDSVNYKYTTTSKQMELLLKQLTKQQQPKHNKRLKLLTFKGIAGYTQQQKPILEAIRSLNSKTKLELYRVDIALDFVFQQDYTELSKAGLHIRCLDKVSNSSYYNTNYYNYFAVKAYSYNRTVKKLDKADTTMLNHVLRLELSFSYDDLNFYNVEKLREIIKPAAALFERFEVTLAGEQVAVKDIADCNLNRSFIKKLNFIDGTTAELPASLAGEDSQLMSYNKLSRLLKQGVKGSMVNLAKLVGLDVRTTGKLKEYYNHLQEQLQQKP